MEKYLVSITNGDYPLMYTAETITDAFQCIMTAAENGNINGRTTEAVWSITPSDELMSVLSDMRRGKVQSYQVSAGYGIKVIAPVEPPVFYKTAGANESTADTPDWLAEERKRWRRFKLTADTKEQIGELNAVLSKHNLSLWDLVVITSCLQLRPGFDMCDLPANGETPYMGERT